MKTEKKGLVSVVTATYNMGHYLLLSIASALNQTYKNLEVLVVDDGSTDNTRELMQKFKDERRIHYIYQENKGQAAAKNRGIQESSGEFIAFLDADDIWKPEKIEKQLNLLQKSKKIGVVYSDVEYMDEIGKSVETEPYKKYYSGKVTNQLFIDNFVNFSSAIARRECFERFGVFDERLPMSIDWDLWLRFSLEYEFAFLNEKAFYYRLWSGQMSHNYEKRYKCIMEIMNRFSKAHSDHLSKDVASKAWALTYFNRGWKSLEIAKKRGEAFRYFAMAIKSKLTYVPAWKGLIKLMLP